MALKLLALGALLATLASAAIAQAPAVNPDADKEDWIVLFNGKDLEGWTPKIAKHELGDNNGNTFRVEDGLDRTGEAGARHLLGVTDESAEGPDDRAAGDHGDRHGQEHDEDGAERHDP